MSPSGQEKRRKEKARHCERERAERDKLEKENMISGNDQEGKDVAGPDGSAPAVRHSDPNDPLSKPPRYSGPPKLKSFNGKKWLFANFNSI